ncbi:toll-like receptor 5, partial [Silurus asotus]
DLSKARIYALKNSVFSHMPDLEEISLADNVINQIERDAFNGLDNLRILNLSNNLLDKIHSETFNHLRNLETLDLSNNNIRMLMQKSFQGLNSLVHLLLSENSLQDVHTLANLPQLKTLFLDNNKITSLYGLPSQTRNVTTIDLRYNRLDNAESVYTILVEFPKIEKISLGGNMFSWCTLNQKYLVSPSNHVQFLDLHLTGLQNLWVQGRCLDMFDHLHQLQMLHLQYNSIRSLPKDIFKGLTSLHTLDLSFNSITYISNPNVFPKSLRTLSLARNHLGSVDPKAFSSLTTLELSGNHRNTFKDLAESGIKTLDLSNGSIFALKNSVFSHMPDLIEISLADNVINQIERDAFNGLDNLGFLNLSNNLLDKIHSDTFNHLRNLETLDLSNNNIKMLMSESFQGLNNLVNLLLSENSLQSLYTIGNLPSLQILYLDNNKITSTFDFQSQTRNITTIDLRYNKLDNAENIYKILVEFPNIEIISLGGNMFSWCTPNQKYSVSPLNNVKFLDLHITGLHKFWLQGQCLDMFDHLHQLQMLYLHINYMRSLPENIFKGLTSLHFLDLSVNALTYIPNGIFPNSLRTLNLASNHLGSVDPQAFSTLTAISLHGNQFLCDCGLADLQTWLNHTDVQMDSTLEELTCEFPEDRRGKPLLHVQLCEDEEDEKIIEELRLALFICWTVLIILISTGAVIFVRLRGYCFKIYKKFTVKFKKGGQNLPANDGFMYDVYLCFSSKDIKWVIKALLEKLDTQFSDQNELRCCFEARDFIPGDDKFSNMRNAIWKSKKTLCVLSREFLKDGWCLEAFSLAQTKMLEEVQDVLLVLLVDDIPRYRLMKYEMVRTYFQTRRYLCWPEDSQDLERFYNHLKQSI